ncbi:MAG: pyridoxine 5'-phosphate synthase [SAR86 cluster bacterium]|uniref:Pyridoxine 5'-phosphate synthase n=1 Tax=SAR86 cluster bacterium TaxID=2030880 RepID=A0A2A5B0J0_9GAMM|nr:MAG: pyridoxine 5'-phosphate synthase [SAR86 cluster bacterium]
MTVLSVNVNKIALLRNSRGRDYPSVLGFVEKVINLGVKGITVHPRPDERHITRRDVHEISEFLKGKPDIEFNIEGYPSDEFLELVIEANPAQCTLVPDKPGQLTSDHGWDVSANRDQLQMALTRLRDKEIRSCLFIDADPQLIAEVPTVNADRIELYTEEYASNYGTNEQYRIFDKYAAAAQKARELGIGINAGHDLDLENLARFLEIPDVLEVSIGHALVVESLDQGVSRVISQYLVITDS